jgi:hypothetical protein
MAKKYLWFDFEEDDSTDAIPDKYILSIEDENGEEVAVIVHRTCGGEYPLDGDVAERKRKNAQMIVDELNSKGGN